MNEFLEQLRQEELPATKFWEVFSTLPMDQQTVVLDIVKTTSQKYQAYLSNEFLRQS